MWEWAFSSDHNSDWTQSMSHGFAAASIKDILKWLNEMRDDLFSISEGSKHLEEQKLQTLRQFSVKSFRNGEVVFDSQLGISWTEDIYPAVDISLCEVFLSTVSVVVISHRLNIHGYCATGKSTQFDWTAIANRHWSGRSSPAFKLIEKTIVIRLQRPGGAITKYTPSR